MERNAYFDNTKAILIILVILGHIVEPWRDSVYGCKVAYLFIYSFHIPVFVFITGYFAKYIKNFKPKEIKYLGLFVIFTFLYLPFTKRIFLTNLIIPYWILWYLISLVCWYLLLPIFKRLRHPILISLIIAITAGYIHQIGYVASISRTLVFLPFFLAGYYLDKDKFKVLTKEKAIAIMAIALVSLVILGHSIDHRWLWGSFSYASLNHPEWFAGVYRLGVYAIAVVVGLSFFSLIPQTKRFYSCIGRYTLWIYLIHGLLIKAAILWF